MDEESERFRQFADARRRGDVPELIEWLADLEWRSAAVTKLGKLGDIRATQPLVKLLRSADSSIRRSTLHALGRIGDPRAVPALIDHAQNDADVAARTWAIGALGQIGARDAIQPLIELLERPEREVRWSAAKTLGEMRADLAREPIRHAMQRDRWMYRGEYRRALGRLRRPLPSSSRWRDRLLARSEALYSWGVRPLLATDIPQIVGGLLIASWLLTGLSYNGVWGLLLAGLVIYAIDFFPAVVWLLSGRIIPRDLSKPRGDISTALSLLPIGTFATRLFSIAYAPGIVLHGAWALLGSVLIVQAFSSAVTRAGGPARRHMQWARRTSKSTRNSKSSS